MYARFQEHIAGELASIDAAGLTKHERLITTPQGAHVGVTGGRQVLNLCANNYLGLAQHPAVNAAAAQGLHDWGYGMASVRFICGTQTLHKQLEETLSVFLRTEDTILYPSCFDANGGLFETLLGEPDAVISDELNHASIIDGIRLSKARRLRYELRVEDRSFFFQKSKEDGSAVATLTYGETLVDFFPRLSTVNQTSKVEVRGWSVKDKEAVSGEAGTTDTISTMAGQKTGGKAK